jgi:hypothetical protein
MMVAQLVKKCHFYGTCFTRSHHWILSWSTPTHPISLGPILILWRILPLLGNDRETNETTAVARQRPARNNGNTVGGGVIYVVRPEAISRDRQRACI